MHRLVTLTAFAFAFTVAASGCAEIEAPKPILPRVLDFAYLQNQEVTRGQLSWMPVDDTLEYRTTIRVRTTGAFPDTLASETFPALVTTFQLPAVRFPRESETLTLEVLTAVWDGAEVVRWTTVSDRYRF